MNILENKLQKTAINFGYEIVPSIGDIQWEQTIFGIFNRDSTKIGTFSYGLTYGNHKFIDTGLNSTQSDIYFENSFHHILLNFQYLRNWKNQWSTTISLEPNTFSNSSFSLSKNDLLLLGSLMIHKKWGQNTLNNNASFGISYGTLYGNPKPYFVFSYLHHFNEKLSLRIGFPESELNYKWNEKNGASFSIIKEGLYANNSSQISINNSELYKNTKLIYDGFRVNLTYERDLSDGFMTYMNIGYLPNTDLKQAFDNGDIINNFKSNESISIGCGIKYYFKTK